MRREKDVRNSRFRVSFVVRERREKYKRKKCLLVMKVPKYPWFWKATAKNWIVFINLLIPIQIINVSIFTNEISI